MKRYVECDCHSEGMVVNVDEEYGFIEVSMWKYGWAYPNHSWRSKVRNIIRHVKQIWKHGEPFLDQVVLDEQAAEELANVLDAAMRESAKIRLPKLAKLMSEPTIFDKEKS
jgi:hypothetical protein